ncbi:hypothetical protein CDAR_267251 [Caerostris darwini]|uniref:Uncharacterized protein n=1 Tax=Caerostris darwini TaxID=1538125 RepID=A0AAV4THS6_9ARAC|nr:hypothetical protein CDAR_267251 [Caerostris darwini]
MGGVGGGNTVRFSVLLLKGYFHIVPRTWKIVLRWIAILRVQQMVIERCFGSQRLLGKLEAEGSFLLETVLSGKKHDLNVQRLVNDRADGKPKRLHSCRSAVFHNNFQQILIGDSLKRSPNASAVHCIIWNVEDAGHHCYLA